MERIDVATILGDLGIKIRSETDTHYTVLCPVHRNTQTSSATISKKDGFLWCFNPNCYRRMPLSDLVKYMRGWDKGKSLRYIEKYSSDEIDVDTIIKEIYADKEEMPTYPTTELVDLQNQFWDASRPQNYMHTRGFNDFVIKEFGIGYDSRFDRICTPMFDTDSRLVGLIRRSIAGKEFKNTKDLPTKLSLFNIQRAKRTGLSTLILTESNFDAMRIHQAGYPNVCATLGGTFSDYHVSQIYRSFDTIILMTDDDEPGLKFGERINVKARKYGLAVYRSRYNEYNLFPHGAKDVCDQNDKGVPLLSDQDISRCIKNASIVI